MKNGIMILVGIGVLLFLFNLYRNSQMDDVTVFEEAEEQGNGNINDAIEEEYSPPSILKIEVTNQLQKTPTMEDIDEIEKITKLTTKIYPTIEEAEDAAIVAHATRNAMIKLDPDAPIVQAGTGRG